MPTTAVELVSERLTLRAPLPGDARSIADQVNDWDVVRYTASIPFPYDIDMARTFVDNQAERWAAWPENAVPPDEVAFMIERNSDRQILGCIGLQPAETGDGVEFGYWIGKAHWRQGYASEAVARLARYAFEVLEVDEIWAVAVPVNDASHGVLQKNGFSIVGAGERLSEVRGTRFPVIVRKLTRGQWAPRVSLKV